MNSLKSLNRIFKESEEIIIDDSSRIVLISDCHRGNGSFADEFLRNENSYYSALNYYYNKDYIYIELGDGDELWENSNMDEIINQHKHVFGLLSKFYNKNRLYFLYGNHDMVKKNDKFLKENLYQYFNERDGNYVKLFENIKIHEGLVLKYKGGDKRVLLIHGHQVDFLNCKLWRVSRFLVRYLWRPLNNFGINDLTRPAKNYKKKRDITKSLIEWIAKEGQVLISGHTHRPSFPEEGSTPYFNTGSCVHPRCITAIEIYDGNISLVKWSVKTKNDGTLFIGRDILVGPENLRGILN